MKFFRVYPKGSPKESRYYSGYERKVALDRAYADMGRDRSLVVLNSDTPYANDLRWCGFCGRKLVEVIYTDEEDDQV